MTENISKKTASYEKNKESLKFFDGNLWWDPVYTQCFEQYDNFDSFISSLKNHSIDKAVLTCAECIKYEWRSGNETLKKLISGKNDLYGAMVLANDYQITGEDIEKYIDEMVDAGMVIARIFPRLLRHSMKKSFLGDVYTHLNARRIPLMIWHAETSWDTIESLCMDYPDMPVIIEGNDVKLVYHNRFYVPLYKKYPNFYLETHNAILFKELDVLADINPEKLIFGSYYQYNAPDTAMAPVIFGNMNENSKEMIAHGNLERLIGAIL